MGQIESAIDAARRSGHGKSGPWTFDVAGGFGTLIHYGTPIFRVNLSTGAGEVGQGAWGSVSDQTGIRKAAQHLSNVLGGTVSVKALAKKEILGARDRARSKGSAFSNPAARRLDSVHALMPDGKIYCADQGDQAAPVVTHSGVKCPFCGKTVQSMHGPSKNPTGLQASSPGKIPSRGKVIREDGTTVFVYHSFTQLRNQLWKREIRDWATIGGMGWTIVPLRGSNPSRKHISADIRAFDRVTREMKALKARDVKELRRKKNPVPSYALLLRRALAKGHPYEEAQDIANRQLQQAAEFLRVPYTESRRQNPAHGPTKIYGRTEKIYMTKTDGPYKGQRFVHSFKPGVEQIGLPRGTKLTYPGGRSERVTTRSVLMTGKKDIWGNYPA